MEGERKGGREKEKEEEMEGKWMDGQMDGHRNLEGCCHPGYCPGKGRTTQAFVLEGSNLHFDVRFLQPLPAPPQSPVQPRGRFPILPICLLQGAGTTSLLWDQGRPGLCACAQGCCCLNINTDPVSRLANADSRQRL